MKSISNKLASLLLTAGVWVGGEDRSIHFNSMVEGQGATMALPIWGKFFNKAYADKTLKLSQAEFPRPASMDPNLNMDCTKYDEGVMQEPETESEFE